MDSTCVSSPDSSRANASRSTSARAWRREKRCSPRIFNSGRSTMTRRIPTLILMLGLAPTLAAAGQVHTGTPTPPTTSGQPLSLAACLTIAHEHQPDLAASEAQVRAAEARLKESHALFRPRIDFGQSYTRQSYNFAAAPGNTPTQVSLFSQPESFANTPYYYAGLTYSQTIYDFGRTRGTVRRSEAEL